ncbi:Rrf2 family transcriptional regulator [bacterium]|nr:Rrf2 family transcriptional regulator [bacterium]
MIRLNKKTGYALIALVDMAAKDKNELTSARELSEKYHISLELLGKLLQTLARNKLLASVQGVKGGYRLNRHPDELKLNDIITAVEGPVHLVACGDPEKPLACERTPICNIRNGLMEFQMEIQHYFDSLSLSDLQRSVAKNRSVSVK